MNDDDDDDTNCVVDRLTFEIIEDFCSSDPDAWRERERVFSIQNRYICTDVSPVGDPI